MKYLDKKEGPLWYFRTYTFEDLRDFIENEILDIGDYVFRGQSNTNWQLTSTLDRLIRHARKTGVKHGPIDQFVEKHLDRFRLEIRGRRRDNPPKLNEDELWGSITGLPHLF